MTEAPARLSRPWLGAIVFLYGSAVAAFVAFVVYRRQGLVEGTVDLNGFGALARNIALGDGFSLGHGPTTRRGPLYPFFGAALLRLFGTSATDLPEVIFYRPLIVANCLILGLTCCAVWRLCAEIFGSRVALVAAMICPLVPQSLRYVGMTEVETLMGLFSVLLALTGVWLLRWPSWKSGVVFGVSAALATLTKPIVLLYPFAFLALAFLHWRRQRALDRKVVIASVAAVACFGALLLPWSLRNMAVTGGQFKGISSNGPGEFLRGYINAQPKYFLLRQDFGGGGPGEKWDPEANTYEENLLRSYGVPFYRSGRDAAGHAILLPSPPPGKSSALMELEKDRIEGAEVKRKVLHEPAGFAYKFVVQFASFWYIVETRSKSLLVGAVAMIMLILAGIGTFRAWRERALIWPVWFVVGYFNAIYAAFLAFARYSMPLFPTLSVLAAAGLVTLLEVLLRRSPRRPAGSARIT
jgi:4-amino-4-deoxy-L-arabinose transferase-like glycosyltransferase